MVPFLILERVRCHQCPHTKRSHEVSGASLMISNSPSSFRQISQINLSPISLSSSHSQREFPPPCDIPFGRNGRSAKNDEALELTHASGVVLALKFLPFPILRLLGKTGDRGISIENCLSIAPSHRLPIAISKPENTRTIARSSMNLKMLRQFAVNRLTVGRR